MRVAITGATGLIGRPLVAALKARGDEVVPLGREGATASALSGTDAIVNLAGEPIAQRWTAATKERIRDSRVQGTEALVEAVRSADPQPRVLVSASAAGYYGDRGAEELSEDSPPGSGFLPDVCVAWERAAQAAAELGVRVVLIRTGVVLDRAGGALKQMLLPFRLGLGGPVAGGRQYISWISLQDIVGLYLAALSSEAWTGPVNACAPRAVTNAELTRALGHALHRPAVIPVPGFALRAAFGEMASVLLESQRMRPERASELGYEFRHAELGEGLVAALA